MSDDVLNEALDRIRLAADVLIVSISKLNIRGTGFMNQADLNFKLALAYYIQCDNISASNYLTEARKAIVNSQTDMIYLDILTYWEGVFATGQTFNERLLSMDDKQMLLFEIMSWYSVMPFNEILPQYQEALSCITKGNLIYCSRKMYTNSSGFPEFTVNYDEEKKLNYVDIKGSKKLYYPHQDKETVLGKVKTAYYLEQVPYSPHLYFTNDFNVMEGDVFCDIGAAEANQALEVAEKCSEIYIFEGEEYWNAALQASFSPYKEKTTIINKMVSDVSSDKYVKLDEYFSDKKVDFLKIDVEGYEMNVLRGAENVLANNKMKLCVCTYHRGNDAREIKGFLVNHGFKTEFSDGFMVSPYNSDYWIGSELNYPYFRYGLIRAWKE